MVGGAQALELGDPALLDELVADAVHGGPREPGGIDQRRARDLVRVPEMVEDETRAGLAQVPRRHRDPIHHLTSSADSVTLVPGVKFRTYIKPEDGVTALSELDETLDPAGRGMVAAGGRLPGLPAQLRRLERRRHRRPARHHRQGALPARAGCRRRVAEPVLPVGAGRRRLRRRRLPRRRPADRHARAVRRAPHRPAPRGHPADRRHRPEPHLQPARVVPGGARRPRRARGPASATSSGRAAASTASCRRATGPRRSAARPGSRSATASGTCTCSPPSSPTSTGPTTRCARSSSRR